MKKKKVLDACCGSRMFWFDKQDRRAVFIDIRAEDHILSDGRKLEIHPDLIMDFRKLLYNDKTFKLVVFDPPHLVKAGKSGWLAKKYGVLGKDWRKDLKKGFKECWRVLDDDGVLIFKWNERDIKISEVLKLFGKKPLFGHTTKKGGHTIWICYMK